MKVHCLSAFVVAFLLVLSANGQAPDLRSSSFQFGDRVIVIPAPDGFEEAGSQFETVRKRMTETEDPGNDMLAVHLPKEDCDRLRQGGFPDFKFYTKVSVSKARRETV